MRLMMREMIGDVDDAGRLMIDIACAALSWLDASTGTHENTRASAHVRRTHRVMEEQLTSAASHCSPLVARFTHYNIHTHTQTHTAM